MFMILSLGLKTCQVLSPKPKLKKFNLDSGLTISHQYQSRSLSIETLKLYCNNAHEIWNRELQVLGTWGVPGSHGMVNFMTITDEKLLFSYNDYNQKRGFKMTTSRDTIINLTRMTSTFSLRQSQLCLQHVSSKNTL